MAIKNVVSLGNDVKLDGLNNNVTSAETQNVTNTGISSAYTTNNNYQKFNAATTNATTESFDVFSTSSSFNNSNNFQKAFQGPSISDNQNNSSNQPTSNDNISKTTNNNSYNNTSNNGENGTSQNNPNQISSINNNSSQASQGMSNNSSFNNNSQFQNINGSLPSSNNHNDDINSSTTSTPSNDDFYATGSAILDATLNASGIASASTDNYQLDVEEFKQELRNLGIQEYDIKRVVEGKITLDALWDEIYNDEDKTRKRYILEASTIHALQEYYPDLNLKYNSINEMQFYLNELTKKIATDQDANFKLQLTEEEATLGLISYMAMGNIDLQDAINEYIVAYRYVDSNGNVHYARNLIEMTDADMQNYTAISYKELYGDSKTFQRLNAAMPRKEKTITYGALWWAKKETKEMQTVEWTDELTAFYNELQMLQQQQPPANTETPSEIQALIDEKIAIEYLLNHINSQIDYYLTNIDPYVSRQDFTINANYNKERAHSVYDINFRDKSINTYGSCKIYQLTSKEEIVNFLSLAINENKSDSILYVDNENYKLQTTDEMFNHYFDKWAHLLSEEEKQVFNYILNTEGTNAAYDFLSDIAPTMDQRWLEETRQNDAEWAANHQVLASIASVLVTPFEGMSAACYSLNSLITGAKLYRTDVYSHGDTYRATVSAKISENSGAVWAFAYDTLMSMADSAALIAVSFTTGGSYTALFSTLTMGSRAYVSSLNNALDRGVTDERAIFYAFGAAAIETACETYSVGHLINLENTLSQSSLSLINKLTGSIDDPVKKSIFEKTLYVAANAISQGLCEGEEELTTEILTFFFDQLACGDLSDFNITVQNYINSGISEDEAIIKALQDEAETCALSFAGGFCSGIFFGGFKAGIVTTNAARFNMDVLDMSAIDMALEMDETLINDPERLQQEVAKIRGIDISEKTSSTDEVILPKLNKTAKSIFNIKDATEYLMEHACLSENAANKLSTIFLDGMVAASTKYKESFQRYREHSALHTTLVEEYTLRIGQMIGLQGEDLQKAQLAAVCHDLGMKGGYYLDSTSINEQGNFIYEFRQIDDGYDLDNLTNRESENLANKARKSHPLNSALTVLTTDIIPQNLRSEVALLAMSHSKSTSGIQHFASQAEWLASVDKLSAALGAYNTDNNTSFTFEAERLKTIIQNEETLQILQDQALAIRDGDAMSMLATNSLGHVVLQNGGHYELDYNHNKVGDYNGEFQSNCLSELRYLEVQDTLFQDGKKAKILSLEKPEDAFSAKIHLGESNVRFDSEYRANEAGRQYRAVASLIEATLAPNCSMAAIEERIGEVATYDNCNKREFIIELPEDARNTNLSTKYEELVTEIKRNGIDAAIIRDMVELPDGTLIPDIKGIDTSKMCFFTGATSAELISSTPSEITWGDGKVSVEQLAIKLTYSDTTAIMTATFDGSKFNFVIHPEFSNYVTMNYRIGADFGNIRIAYTDIIPELVNDPNADTTRNNINGVESSDQVYFITDGLNSTEVQIPLKELHEIIFNDEKYQQFIVHDTPSRQAYIQAIEKYVDALHNSSVLIKEKYQNRIDKILSLSKAATNFTDYIGEEIEYPLFGKVTKYQVSEVEDILFNEEKYNSLSFMTNMTNIFGGAMLYFQLAPIKVVYDKLAASNITLSQTIQERLKYLNSRYLDIVNKPANNLKAYSSYGANQNAVRQLALNPNTNKPLYDQMVKIVKSYYPHMSMFNINRLLKGINVTGICTYATIINEVILKYNGREAEFRRDFGYDLYRLENGNRVLNDALLLTDLYCSANEGNDFVIRKKGLSYDIQDDSKQNFMANSSGTNITAIQKWFSRKGIKYQAGSYPITNYVHLKSINYNTATINYLIGEALIEGANIHLGVYVHEKEKFEFGFYPTNSIYPPVFSNIWSEGSGHSVLVTGLTNEGDLLVSSWGKEYIMRWSELSKSTFVLYKDWFD